MLEEIALFFVDFLIEDREGYLVTCPSVSPENRFVAENGFDTPVCAGPAMDNQILRALMRVCLEAAEILGIQSAYEKEFKNIIDKVRPDQIDSQGRLMEWAREEKELTPDMVHTSQIDGNLGLLAGMAECILQSHIGIHFLPVLPPKWRSGQAKGLRARGAMEVDMEWKNGRMYKAVVRPEKDGETFFIGEAPKEIRCRENAVSWETAENGYRVHLEKGKSFEILY